MAESSTSSLSIEQQLADEIVRCEHDPYRYVMFAFPWGEGELKDKAPRDWQIDILQSIGERLAQGDDRESVIREAVASGHGIGKSALVSWIMLWAISTKVDTKGVVTANTETQLKTKTWAELGKWHRLAINSTWFEYTATALFAKDKDYEKTWRIDMVPWSERNTEAFAGLHNEGKRLLLIFDEASAIPDVIWEVSEGALTDERTEIIWACFGNPTRNTGRFKECFGRLRHRWRTQQIDSRTVPGTNKNQIAEWIDDYGEDSDFVRVRVRGVFPRAGSNQFIDTERVDMARERQAAPLKLNDQYFTEPVVVGVDVARFGDDQSVIRVRAGRDAASIKPLRFRGMDTMTLASKVAEVLDGSLTRGIRPDACFVDGGGVGGGVVDRLIQMNYDPIEVNFGGKPNDRKYANKRAEMWGNMREWLLGGSIDPDDIQLEQDLVGVEYNFNMRNEIQLEKKEDMKKRGLASPDDGDSLALTFAFPVAKRQANVDLPGNKVRSKDYDPLDRT